MNFSFGIWDFILMFAVSIQATMLAYMHNPKIKAILYSIPIPFTLASLSLGHPIDVTHVLGLPMVFIYTNGVRWLYVEGKLPIIIAIIIGALVHCVAGVAVARFVPVTEKSFWIAITGVTAFSVWTYMAMPEKTEEGHKSPLPVIIKFILIMLIIAGLIIIKKALRGFMAFFPMVGVVAAYEARNCLWTLGRQVPVLMLGMCPLLAICHVTQSKIGLAYGLLTGWVAFLAVLAGFSRRLFMEERNG